MIFFLMCDKKKYYGGEWVCGERNKNFLPEDSVLETVTLFDWKIQLDLFYQKTNNSDSSLIHLIQNGRTW